MGLKRSIDLEVHTGRERPRDIIGKMPTLARSDFFGGAPGYSAGGEVPNFGTGYDTGCPDCLPECDVLKLCAWPQGELYWPTEYSSGLSHPIADGYLQHSFSYRRPAHFNVGPGYSETVRYNTYVTSSIVNVPEGSFPYPLADDAPYFFVPMLFSLTGSFKTPSDNALSPTRPLTEDNPFMPMLVSVRQHEWTSGDGLAAESNPALFGNGDRPVWPEIARMRDFLIEMVPFFGANGSSEPTGTGSFKSSAIGVPTSNRIQLSARSSVMDIYDFHDDFPTFQGDALGGYSLEFTVRVLGLWTPDPGIFAEPNPRLLLGSARGCSGPPPGQVVEAQKAILQEDGSFRLPTPASSIFAVYFDGLLAVPGRHYSIGADGEIIPQTALVQGTRVAAIYRVDGV